MRGQRRRGLVLVGPVNRPGRNGVSPRDLKHVCVRRIGREQSWEKRAEAANMPIPN